MSKLLRFIRPSNTSTKVTFFSLLVTGSRAPLTALQAAKVVAVITSDDIQRAAATSVNDVLKLVSGVDVRQRGGFGVQTDISINGGTFDQITILLNGVNISNPHRPGRSAGACSGVQRKPHRRDRTIRADAPFYRQTIP